MRTAFLTFLILILISASAAADDDRDARLERVLALKARVADREGTSAGDPELTPMLAEIQAVLDSARVVEAGLRAAHPEGAADDPGSPLALALAEHRTAVRLQVLKIQARHARREGRTDLEQRILKSIAEIERPAPPGGPRMKPVPSPTAIAQDPR